MNLEFLWLYLNNLHGSLRFDMFFDMKSLNSFKLGGNRLSLLFGDGGNANATLPKFKALGLSSCNISEFPDFLRHQNKLELLYLRKNKIHGRVPEWMWNTSVESLMYMDLSCNFLTSFYYQSSTILPWINLRILDLSSNKLQGPLLIPPPSTRRYDVSNNRLTGEIPPLICNSSSLWTLDLSNNNFTGEVPQCLGNFNDFLAVLNLRNNSFEGFIPQACKHGRNLRMIDLSDNQFQGQLPRSLAACTMLEYLDLSNNHLVDVFPTWLGTLPQLKLLILRQNGFYGAIGKPEKSSDFPKLRIIDLAHNNHIGDLPYEYMLIWNAMKSINTSDSTYLKADVSVDMEGKYLNFTADYPYSMTIVNKGLDLSYRKIQEVFAAIDLSSKKFRGEIPEVIRNLKGLHLLNLSNNMLTGHIPSSLGNLSNLESLDLSQNKLLGEIPQQLQQLTFLESFNVSHNELLGPIPRGNQLNTFDSSSFADNLGLCGEPLPNKCGDLNIVPPSVPEDEDDDSDSIDVLKLIFVFIGFIYGLVVGVILGNLLAKKMQGCLDKTFAGRLLLKACRF